MQYIILDLEWNGAYSKKIHRYFNEIIEIGAVKLNENLENVDTFQAFVKPVISKKITNLVANLTGIEDEVLEDGGAFTDVAHHFRKFMGTDGVLLTWSISDLLVLLENCKYFFGSNKIPFLTYYLDAQAYCQSRMDSEYRKQQLGLTTAAEALNVPAEDLSAHRAKDDSMLTARILQKVFEESSFEAMIRLADDSFYERLSFKSRVVNKIKDPLVRPEYLIFQCPNCGANLKPAGKWRYTCKALCTQMKCTCGKEYTARLQIRELFDRVAVRKRLSEQLPPEKQDEAECTE